MPQTEKPAYKRVLLKLSGEALAGTRGFGLDFAVMRGVCAAVKRCAAEGVEVGLVVGGGNFWRGAKDGGGTMERSRADHMGMLATVMNCLAVSDVMEQNNIPVRVQTATEMRAFAETYTRQRAVKHLEEGKVVLFAGGTGCPYFSTDTAAVLRACEIDADAVKYDNITYDEVLAQHLAVMDSTATSLAMDNHLPVFVFALSEPENILRAITGEAVGTLVE